MLRVAIKNLRPVVAASPRVHQLAVRHASTGRSAWLRDPAVYPLLGVIGSAGLLVSSFLVYYVNSSPDIRYNKAERQNVVRAKA